MGLEIGDALVNPTTAVRSLGVILDSTLSFKEQIGSVCKRSFYHLRRIASIKRHLNRSSLCRLLHAFVTSTLDYGNSLLAGLPVTQVRRLQRVQNSAARLVTGTTRRDSATRCLKDLHWLPISFRIQFKIAVLTYHALHKNGPEYIGELIGLHRPVRTLRSGDSLDLVVPHTRKVTFGDRAFAAFAPTLWNSLPLSVRQSETSSSFCSSLKTHLFHLAFPPSQSWILCDGKRLCTFDGKGAIEITHIIIIIIINDFWKFWAIRLY